MPVAACEDGTDWGDVFGTALMILPYLLKTCQNLSISTENYQKSDK
jgi:hypothetical protein